MSFVKFSQYACLLVAVAMLTACGGGGGDDSDNDNIDLSLLTVPTSHGSTPSQDATSNPEPPTVDELIDELGDEDTPDVKTPSQQPIDEANIAANPEPVTSTLTLIALTTGALAATRRRRSL